MKANAKIAIEMTLLLSIDTIWRLRLFFIFGLTKLKFIGETKGELCRTEFNKLSILVRLHVQNWELKAVCETRGTFNNSIVFSRNEASV